MANARMISRSFFLNEEISKLSDTAKILYIGTIIFADDDGRAKAGSYYLKASIFPGSDIKLDRVMQLRREIETAVDEDGQPLIEVYKVGNQEYLHHPNWKKHQHIRSDKYRPSELPSPTSRNQQETSEIPQGIPQGIPEVTPNQIKSNQVNLSQSNLSKVNQGGDFLISLNPVDNFKGFKPEELKILGKTIAKRLNHTEGSEANVETLKKVVLKVIEAEKNRQIKKDRMSYAIGAIKNL